LKGAVQVAVEDMILPQVSHHSEADLVLPQRKLNGNPCDLNLSQCFLVDGPVICGGDRGEQRGPNSPLLQPIGYLPGLLGRFQAIRLEGFDGSQDSQSVAGLEDFRAWE